MRGGKRCWFPTRSTPEEAYADALKARRGAVGPTIGDGMDTVRRHLETKGARPATVRWYAKGWKVALRRWSEETPLASISPAQVQSWISGLGVNGSTARGYLRPLRRLFTLTGTPDPTRGLTLPRSEERPIEPLSRDEVFRIAERLPERPRKLALCLFATGLRRTEFAEFRPEHVRDGILYVERGKMRPRAFPIPDRTAELLAGWEPPPSRRQEQRAKWVYRTLHDQRAKLGLDDRFRPHNLRHSLGAHLAREGVGENVIGAILGHRAQSRSMTLHYMASFGADVRQALELVWP